MKAGAGFWAGATAFASAPFSVTPAGVFKATSATITGNVTANSGLIGGFTVNSTEGLYSGTGTTRVQMKAGAGFWAGATAFADAPFRVSPAGVLVASNATITGTVTASAGAIGGWTIGATTISSTGVKMKSGASASLAFGATPPTSPTAGTGIYINKTGLFGLNANVQQAYINSTGQLIAGAGAAQADVNGFTVIPTTAWNNVHSFKIATANGATVYAGFGGYLDGVDTYAGIQMPALTSRNSFAVIKADAPTGNTSEIMLDACSADFGHITVVLKAKGAGDSSISLNNAPVIISKGLNVGSATGAGTGDVAYSGALKSYKNGTLYAGYAFVPLTTPLTSTAWDGNAYSTTAKTLIDLSAVFGAPAGIKAILAFVVVRDSGSATGDTWLILGPTSANWIGMQQIVLGRQMTPMIGNLLSCLATRMATYFTN